MDGSGVHDVPSGTLDKDARGAESATGHGPRVLPHVTVDTYNEELRDEEGFVGDRASGRAFSAILDDWRERVAATLDEDPFGDTPTGSISKATLDELLTGDDTVAAFDVAVVGLDQDRGAAHAIAARIGLVEFADRLPRADVAPVEACRHDGAPRRTLHHGIVDRDVGLSQEARTLEAQRLRARIRGIEARLRRSEHVRTRRRSRIDQRSGGEAEHAGVPVVVAARDVGFGRRAIGLLAEGGDLATAALRDRCAGLDIAESGFRMSRAQTEGDEVAIGGQTLRFTHGGNEGFDVTDQMIRGQHEQGRIRAVTCDLAVNNREKIDAS